MINSFDIFDTLLTRAVYKPQDLFYFIGKELSNKKIINIDQNSFKENRIKAEIYSRQKKSNEEITLDDIYFELQKLLSINNDILEYIKLLECTMENNFSYSIDENIKKIKEDSIIISDMYLPEIFIKDLLLNNGIKYKELFLSSRYKLTKHTGNLYDIAIKKYKDIYHLGDNIYSDFKIPIKKNIRANHYVNSNPTIYENNIYHNKQLDFELKSILSGAMKAARLNKHYDNINQNTIHEVSSNIIAPFLYIYVDWVINIALENKIEKLYFISRDGQILYKIAKIILNQKSLKNIQISYLYGSRKAWHLPSISEINESVLEWIFDPTMYLSVEDICNRVDMNIEVISEYLKQINIFDFKKNLNELERLSCKELFRNNTNIHKIIIGIAKERRKIVIDYLKQEGFNNNSRIGIVDVGWRGRQQVSLSKILDYGDIYPETGIYGFYISLINKVNSYKNDSYFTLIDKERFVNTVSCLALFEIFVAADHGSCIGYKYSSEQSKIIPLLREPLNTKMLNWGLEIQQNCVLCFTTIIIKNIILCNTNIKQHTYLAITLLKKFFNFPQKQIIYTFGDIDIYEDQEENISYKLCEKILLFDILKFFLFKFKSINHNIWLEGSIILSFNNLVSKLIINSIRIGKKIMRLIK